MKKIIVGLLTLVFLSSVISPAFADTQAERDARQARTVLAAVGIVALVGAIFMINRMSKNFGESEDFSFGGKTLADKGFTIDLGCSDPKYYNSFQGGDDLKFAPALTVKYSW